MLEIFDVKENSFKKFIRKNKINMFRIFEFIFKYSFPFILFYYTKG